MRWRRRARRPAGRPCEGADVIGVVRACALAIRGRRTLAMATVLRVAMALLGSVPAGQAGADAGGGLFLSATRQVFPAAAREVSLQVYNENAHAVIVQAWVDAGDIHADPAAIDVPFVVLPPLMRLQAHEARAVRILYLQQPLPPDRESVFWFNAQMVPPQRDAPARPNVMDVSVRIRQKIFFRPSRLTGGSGAWMESLACRETSRGATAILVHCRNPSPYFATIDRLSVREQEGTYTASGEMLEPFGNREFHLQWRSGTDTPDGENRHDRGKLRVTAIGDDGHVQVLPPGNAGP